MEKSITEIEDAMTKLRKGSPWSSDTKVSGDFLDPLFDTFFEKLGLPNMMRKSSYHELAQFLSADSIDTEVSQVLDVICEVADRAQPVR